MGIYLSWNQNKNNVYEREDFLFKKEYSKHLTTKGLCWSCQVFDHAQQKCTHPELGCDTNKIRIEPWEKGVLCPKKFKLS